jgi:hypothetical protein
LAAREHGVICTRCGADFRITEESILELVDPDRLDQETARELRGNTFAQSEMQMRAGALKEQALLWRDFYSRNRKRSIEILNEYLGEAPGDRLFFLGSGTGRDVAYLLSFRELGTVYCSDLSLTSLRMIPHRLAAANVQLGLFTSDLQDCPVAARDVPLIIVNALHHTQDMHEALRRLMAHGYEQLFLIEPTDNFLIRALAGRGLSRRVEYSGVRPGRLQLSRLRVMADEHRYGLRVTTDWGAPEDYYRRLFGQTRWIERIFFPLLDTVARVTNLFKFGNVSIVHLQRLDGSV